LIAGRLLNILDSVKIKEVLLQKLQILDEVKVEPSISFSVVFPSYSKKKTSAKHLSHPYITHTDAPNTLATLIIPFPKGEGQRLTHGIRFLKFKDWTRTQTGELKNLPPVLGYEKGGSTHAHSFQRNSAISFRAVPSVVGGEVSSERDVKRTDDITKKVWNSVPGIYHYEKSGDVNFPSWHSAPSIGYDNTCASFEPRRVIFMRWSSNATTWDAWPGFTVRKKPMKLKGNSN